MSSQSVASTSTSTSTRKKILILGSNFAGLTAAVELKKKLGDAHDITVVARDEDFLFMPSLIWLPFGKREKKDITFPLAPIYKDKQIDFKIARATRIDPRAQSVDTDEGQLAYDYLVIATGPVNNWSAVPGLGPVEGHTHSIFGLADAEKTKVTLDEFWQNPGPVVIGAVQGAGCFGAAYEFLLNFNHQLKKRGLREKVSLTYVTAEPFLGHFGIGGFGMGQKMVEMFFKKEGIQAITNVAVKEVRKNEMVLSNGETLPFVFSMMAPSFLGTPAVRELTEMTNPAGFVNIKNTYQTEVYPNVYAAGVAIHLPPPAPTEIACGVPKTGYLSEEMAKVVAHNIVADIRGEKLLELAPGSIDAKCVLDAGDSGIIMTSDALLEPRDHAWLIPGPEAHWAKLAFEKYFITTRKHGWI